MKFTDFIKLCLSIYPSTHPHINPFINPSIHNIHSTIVHPSIHTFIHPSIYNLLIHQSIYMSLSIYSSIYLSLQKFIYLSYFFIFILYLTILSKSDQRNSIYLTLGFSIVFNSCREQDWNVKQHLLKGVHTKMQIFFLKIYQILAWMEKSI